MERYIKIQCNRCGEDFTADTGYKDTCQPCMDEIDEDWAEAHERGEI